MKKIKAIAYILMLTFLLSLILACCGLRKQFKEDEIYKDKINSFFDALERKDADAIKSLFSLSVIQNDADLDEQIAKLISIYPNAKTEVLFDGLLGSDHEMEYGKYKSKEFSTFPVICASQYYWVYFELIYEDDFSAENIGVNSIHFYTADEYCAFFRADNAKNPDESGLSIFAEMELENDVRPIEGNPYEFIPIERTINISDVEAFLESNRSWSDFTQTFGEPNARDSLWSCYYEIIEKDGTTKYLRIGVPDGEIAYADVVGAFEYVRTLQKEKKD